MKNSFMGINGKKGAAVFAAAVCVAGLSFSAQAQSTLELVSGTNVVSVAGTGGFASYNGSVGSWQVNVSTGLAVPLDSPGAINLNSTDITTTGSTTPLYIFWSATGYFPSTYTAQAGGTLSAGLTASFSSFYGASLSTNTALTPMQTFSALSFSGNTSGTAVGSGPFYITEEEEISGAGTPGSINQISYAIQSVPEPSTVALVLAGGSAVIGLCKRRRQS